MDRSAIRSEVWWRPVVVAAIVLAATAFACGGSGHGGIDSSAQVDGGLPDLGLDSTDQVGGTAIITWVNARGSIDVPVDYTGATIGAFTEDTTGTHTYYEGSGTVDGTFSVPGVPTAAPFVLRVKEASSPVTLVIASGGEARTFDLGNVWGGRPDVALSMSQTTAYAFDLALGVPWDSNYWYIAFDFRSVTTSSDPASVTPGATTLHVDFTGPYTVLLDGVGRGDILSFTTMRSTPLAGGLTATILRSALVTSDVVITDGVENPVTGTLALPPQKTLAADWRRSEFAAHRADLSPTATDWYDHVSVTCGPPLTSGATVAVPLALALVSARTGTSDATFDVMYGDPFPDGWRRVVSAATHTTVALSPPDAGSVIGQGAGIQVSDFAENVAARPIRPLVTPARAFMVEGASALAEQSGFGLTPELTWQPPAIGAPSLYRISVFMVLTAAEASSGRRPPLVAEMYTASTRARIPPGILDSGRSYSFWLTTIVDAGGSPTRPLRATLPRGTADCPSALMHP
jgi:hypothetical protein